MKTLSSKSKSSVKMSSHKRDREKKLLKPNAIETPEEVDTNNAPINVETLERRLEGLRETQECVQSLSMWCQQNKKHSTPIIETWFKVLKNNPVEKRLTLLYLANDVIQHSKKKNDAASVTAWGSAVQKAIPHVRTPSSVSIQIGRMFKIWEERNVYPKEYIKDFQQLLNQVPAKDRVGEKSNKPETYTASADKVSAFEPPALISKVKLAYRQKSHLGVTFRSKKFVDMDMEGFKNMIKDRNQGHEVIQEIAQYLEQLRQSEAKLSLEVEERRKIVETSEIALVFYENVRGEAKIVHAAYNTFTARVLATKQKVDEKIKAFDEMEGTISPVPSPPAAAPSPPLDEDDFGVRPADKCGGSYTPNTIPPAAASYIEVIQNNTKEIPTEPKTIDTSVPPPISNQSTGNNSYTAHHDPKSNSNPYMDVMTSIQQIQQAWSTSGMIDSYATMSMSMPNVFMQQFPQASMPIMSTGYGVPLQPPPLQTPYGSMSYDNFQPNPPDHQTSPPLPPPDLSTIPLPPGPNPQPPPPLPQEAPPDLNNMYSTPQPPPPPANPFEQQEYDPMYSQHSNFPEPVPYDPSSHQYNSQPSPNDISPNRYHPYNNQAGRGRRSSGPGVNNGNHNSNRYSNNNSSPTGSQIPPLISSAAPADISPMERFTQSLSKNRSSTGNNQPVPESPVNSAGDWGSLKNEDISQSNFVQSQNPYYNMNNSFSDYDDSGHAQEGMNGNEIGAIEPYIPSNMYDQAPQGIRGGPRGNMNRGGRGMNLRGHRGGNRGGIQNSRGGFPGGAGGFRGARGRGMVRGAGPPRGRGVNMF